MPAVEQRIARVLGLLVALSMLVLVWIGIWEYFARGSAELLPLSSGLVVILLLAAAVFALATRRRPRLGGDV
jgi:membrane protein YdbS with pleckstrin-like domain